MTEKQFNHEKLEDRILAAISYLGVLCLIPLFGKKDSAFVEFHAKQGLVLFIIEAAAFFINIIPFIGQAIWFFFGLVFLAVSIFGVSKALKGEYWRMPVLGKYTREIRL
ncbi:DUF4870 domain-containing protein [Candidatus Falkowbacteria bacterium]|nr:DUF4870 domain-containing protein [Candidatus Falkowbacteria bacterium]